MTPALRQVLFAGTSPVPGALMDTFQTTTTAMNGTAFTPYGGATWVQDPGTSGSTVNPQVAVAGSVKINAGGTISQNAIWSIPPAPTAARWATFRLNPSYAVTNSARPGSFRIVANPVVITPTSSYATTAFTFEVSTAGLGATRMYHSLSGPINNATVADAYPANSESGKKQGEYVSAWPGDLMQVRKKTVGAVVTYDFYSNGYKVASNAVDIAAAYAAAGLTLNDGFGIKGDIQASTPNLMAFFETGDPATQAMLTVKKMGHTAQIKWWDSSNDTYVPLKGEYSLSAPTALYYSVVNAATGATVSGPTPLSGLSTTPPVNGVGTWTVTPVTIPAASTPAVFYVKIERQDIVGQAKVFGFTPNMNAGWIVGFYDQSITTLLWSQAVTGITVTPPANGWMADGSIDQNDPAFPGVNTDFRVHISSAVTKPYDNNVASLTYAMQPIITASGNANLGLTFIRGGYGGTYQSERQPLGTHANATHGVYEALRDGIDRVGDVGIIHLNGGTYEIFGATSTFGNSLGAFAYGTDSVTFKGQVDTFVQAIEAYVGHPVKVILGIPPGIDSTNTATLDARAATLWRSKFELVKTNGVFGTVTAGNPQRYFTGATAFDLQHKSADTYHLNTNAADGWGELARRYGYSLAQVMGYAANDRNGPTIDDTQQPVRSGATIKLWFNLNGASTVALTGFAFASDGRGGMQFWTDNTFTTELLCTTTPSIGTPSGGKVDVTWTLTTTPGAPVVVRGPRGLSPFNRAQNATIITNMMTDASVLRGTFADPEATFFNPPVQPYFNGSFLSSNSNDYLTST